MSTSGSYNWTINRDEALLRACQEANILGQQDTVSDLQTSNIYEFVQYKLSAMLSTWSIDGIKISKRKVAYLFPALLQHKYELGSPSGASNITNTYVSTTISANEAAGQTVLSITSTTGMTAADFIGIELNSGTRQWTTIVSVDSTTQVTVTAALTGAADAAKTVVSYTSKINRPLEVLYGTTLDIVSSNLTEVEIAPLSHDEYLKMPVKNTVGRPNNFYYDGQQNNSNPFTSSIYVYPEPQNVTNIIKLVYVDRIQDLDSSTDSLDLPSEWFETVVMNLACALMYSYGKKEMLGIFEPKAKDMYELLKQASADDTSITFSLDGRS